MPDDEVRCSAPVCTPRRERRDPRRADKIALVALREVALIDRRVAAIGARLDALTAHLDAVERQRQEPAARPRAAADLSTLIG